METDSGRTAICATRIGAKIIQSLDEIQHLAWQATEAKNMCDEEVVVFVVELESPWKNLATGLLTTANLDPNVSLKAYFPDGLAKGLGGWEICTMAARLNPHIARELQESPVEGHRKCIIFHRDGIMPADVLPKSYTN